MGSSKQLCSQISGDILSPRFPERPDDTAGDQTEGDAKTDYWRDFPAFGQELANEDL